MVFGKERKKEKRKKERKKERKKKRKKEIVIQLLSLKKIVPV